MRPPDRNIFWTVGGVQKTAARIKIWHDFGNLKNTTQLEEPPQSQLTITNTTKFRTIWTKLYAIITFFKLKASRFFMNFGPKLKRKNV
jgi:hypothetical protein